MESGQGVENNDQHDLYSELVNNVYSVKSSPFLKEDFDIEKMTINV